MVCSLFRNASRVVATSLVFCSSLTDATSVWTITQAKRTVYASGNVATVDVRVQAKNTGSSTRKSFVISTTKLFGRPAHVVAYGSSVKNVLTVEGYNLTSSTTEDKNSAVIIEGQSSVAYSNYVVKFNKGIEAGKTVTFTYSMSLGIPFTPMPRTIHLYQRQFLQYHDTLYIPSVYPVESQVTNIELASSGTAVENIEPVDVGRKEQKSSNMVKFGPFDNVGVVNFFDKGQIDADGTALEKNTLMVHFSNQEHQTYFPTVKREIEVSHWGNVAFKELYELKHAGAAVTSAFNRVGFSWGDYRKRGMQAPENPVSTAMYEMNVVLPRTARNIHYRDEIGNISSSNARRDDRGYVLAQIRPRFPVLGGWHADWEFSYDVPTRSALKVDPEDPTLHVLNVTLSPPIVRTFTRKMDVEVLLPEGASEIQLFLPSNKIKSAEWRTVKNSWLDFFGGRPTVGFTLEDFYVPEKQILQYKFQVAYRQGALKVYYEPVFLSVLIWAFFLAYIGLGRSTLRIATRSEGKLLDQREVAKSVARASLDKFDALVGDCEQMMKRADAHARTPVKHKWEPYVAKQKEALKLQTAELEAAISGNKAVYTGSEKLYEKTKSLLKGYLEHQLKHVDARAGEEGSASGEGKGEEGKGDDGKKKRASALEQLESKADSLEAELSESLRQLSEL